MCFQMRENVRDDRDILDARDVGHRPTTDRADLDVDADQIAPGDVVEWLEDDVRRAVAVRSAFFSGGTAFGVLQLANACSHG